MSYFFFRLSLTLCDRGDLVQTRAKRRMLIATLSIAVVCLLFLIFWARARHELVLQGTLQTGPEQSAFFLDGDCSKIPFWFNWPDQRDYNLNTRWQTLGEPAALRVKLLGRVSDVGKYGHLGAYPREVQPTKMISVNPTLPCPWPGDR